MTSCRNLIVLTMLLLSVSFLTACDSSNSPEDIYNQGCQYYKGDGVSVDKQKAVELWQKAAELGNDKAQYNLGACYNDGDGVEKNKEEAVKWFRKAAEQGNAEAQFNLGNRYYAGDGVGVVSSRCRSTSSAKVPPFAISSSYSPSSSSCPGRSVAESSESSSTCSTHCSFSSVTCSEHHHTYCDFIFSLLESDFWMLQYSVDYCRRWRHWICWIEF